jgi:hypothetical protein
MGCDKTGKKDKGRVTHPLFVMGYDLIRTPGKGKIQAHSQTVGHGMQHGEKTLKSEM